MESSIFSLSSHEVKALLADQNNYSYGVALPEYIDFQPILDRLFSIDDSNLTEKGAISSSGANFKIMLNKDGRYSWRLIELIHPVLYAHIVNTVSNSWDEITERPKRLLEYNNENGLSCASQLWCIDGKLMNQQLAWWKHFEQYTLAESLKFNYIHKIDISGCYDSIYTHSIAWAIHGKDLFCNLNNQKDPSLIGNKLDKLIRSGRQNQTNGIPQGSLLSDLLAELVLIDIDYDILNKLKGHTGNFRIIRYVDDYNVLTDSSQTGEAIIKAIAEVLADRRMRINELKVISSENIVKNAVKSDKVPLLSLPQAPFTSPPATSNDFTTTVASHNRILQIYNFSCLYPNSGSLKKLLIELRNLCNHGEYLQSDTIPAIVAILAKISIYNPKVIPICVSIIERSLSVVNYDDDLIGNLQYAFQKIPFTDYIDIWLQRMLIGCKKEYTPQSLMTQCIDGGGTSPCIWDNSWITCSNVKEVLERTPILDHTALDAITPDINIDNLNLWSYDDQI